MNAQVLSELGAVTGAPHSGLLDHASAHDTTLEPTDDTIAEVQCLVVQSRQVGDLDSAQLVAVLCHCITRVVETKNPGYAVAIAAFALRLKEEHLV